ncbi:hypothetical protein [Nocardia bovistercoris]|uniref:Uncharacterized protein n=1 Tax=Nocardia bovistercoris TaxID=2785916 RepID=A0A931IH70_9NOCA|nr:hypothetical protein [Nocardia bovistercoris]MBH0779665.1 hypothetical protein [Nocardia bovistercoris]
MNFSFREYFRWWAGPAAAAGFAFYGFPVDLFFLTMQISHDGDDPRRRILIAPRLEVNIEGLWLLDDAAD